MGVLVHCFALRCFASIGPSSQARDGWIDGWCFICAYLVCVSAGQGWAWYGMVADVYSVGWALCSRSHGLLCLVAFNQHEGLLLCSFEFCGVREL
jgi:hypothetical protein